MDSTVSKSQTKVFHHRAIFHFVVTVKPLSDRIKTVFKNSYGMFVVGLERLYRDVDNICSAHGGVVLTEIS